jgi:hypothetical protein
MSTSKTDREAAAERNEQWQDRFTLNGEFEWVLRESEESDDA